MKKPKLPKTDSIKKLADFWDGHDLTDFEDELEEVTEPVFARSTAIKVPLEAHEAKAVERMAKAKGVSREELVRAWVLQKVARGKTGILPSAGDNRRTQRVTPVSRRDDLARLLRRRHFVRSGLGLGTAAVLE